MALYGESLLSLGYRVLPIQPTTKKPGRYLGADWVGLNDWQEYCKDAPATGTVAMWRNWPGCGIGVACGNIVAIDIDVLDENVADDIEVVIRQQLGNTPLKRVGKAPKCLLVYRTTEPFKKMLRGPIEALCNGQQFVAYSIHPDTGAEYTWPDEHLHETPMYKVPQVSSSQVERALEMAYELLPDELKAHKRLEVVASSSQGEASASTSELGLTAHRDAIESALEKLDNPDLHWDDWNKIGMALWAASSGAEWAAGVWHTFSGRSSKYKAHDTSDRWGSYFKSRPHSVGAGTLFAMAEREGWCPPSNLNFHLGTIDTSGVLVDIEDLNSPPTLRVIEGDAQPREVEEQKPAPANGFTMPDGSFPHAAWLEDNRSPVAQVAQWMIDTAMFPLPELALGSTLSMFGTLFGRNFRMERFGTRTNMIAIGVAPTGSGKEHSRNRIKLLVEDAGYSKLLGGDNIASGAAVESMLRDHPSRLNMIDEIGHFLSGVIDENAKPHYKDLSKRILEIYSASSSVYKGTQYADTKTRPAIDIINPIWCIYGTTTMETLRPLLQRRSQQDGTLPRLIFFNSERRPTRNFDIDNNLPPPSSIVAFLKAMQNYAPEGGGNLSGITSSMIAPEVVTVGWHDDAFEVYKSMCYWQDEMVAKRGVVWTRLMENATKIAMIEAISLDPQRAKVTAKSMQKAFDLMYWSTLFLEKSIRDESAENEQEAITKRVLSIIRDKGQDDGVSGSDLSRATQFLKRKDRLEIVEGLKETGQVREEKAQTAGGGRPSIRYFPV